MVGDQLQLCAWVSIHAFRGEGDADRGIALAFYAKVSIHAFRGEGDAQ